VGEVVGGGGAKALDAVRERFMGLRDEGIKILRRAAKGAAAMAFHYTGAEDLLASVQRRAVGGRRVLILSYHRVVGNFDVEATRSLPTLNIAQDTFRKHLETLAEDYDIVTLDRAVEVLEGKARSRRDVAVVTFDDGYRDVYDHAFPVMRDMKVPGIVYVPSAFTGTNRRIAHDRLWSALVRMKDRRLGPVSVGVGGRFESMLLDAYEGAPTPNKVLENLISNNPTAVLYDLSASLEDRLGLSESDGPKGQLPMSWEMLREMGAVGVETGAHTADHTVLTNQPLDEARREIAQCRAVLEKGVGRPVRHFAYCNGWYSAGVAQALKSEGFVTAVTTEDLPNLPGVDPYALKRKVLWENSSAGILGAYSKAVTACTLNDTLGTLALTRPVLGARPTYFGRSGGQSQQNAATAAHG
jgi:peptidoglycan/xylan/chitin deacetylase (PgdA/CDA1 family)